MVTAMSEWMQGIIDEMIEAGLVEEVEPGVVQKLGGHGWKLVYSDMEMGDLDTEQVDRDHFKISLLSIMEAPDIMGVRVDDKER